MNVRRTLVATLFLVGTLSAGVWTWRTFPSASGVLGAAPAAAEEVKTWYTCGMHPEVVQDHPGNCPKCGMKLQPMSADRAAAMGLTPATESAKPGPSGTPSEDRKILYWKSSMIPGEIHDKPGKDSMGMDLVPVYEGEAATTNAIRIDPIIEQDMGVRTDKVIVGPVEKSVRTVGIIDYDETSLASVTTKVDGWIEKLYVDQTGAQVHEGDALFDLYSPALYSAQEEYLAALRRRGTNDASLIPDSRLDSEALVRDARTRLEYFDVPAEEITRLENSRVVRKTLTIRAPFTGIVTHKNVVEGQKISAGVDLFRIADLSTVWLMGKVFEYDVPFVKLGQEALMRLTYLPGRTYRGRVTYVYPYLDPKTRTLSVRMEFHNPGYELKPGMYATVELSGRIADSATLVPDVAVIRTGRRSVAFTVPKPGRFEPREVEIGARAQNNYLQVLSGLEPGETVVISGQFLLDSESRLREAALKMLEPGAAGGATPIEDVTAAAAAKSEGKGPETATQKEAEERGQLYYVCPMPAHSDILYDKPGKCPICGMKLVPVEKRAGSVHNPKILYWTCPMPEHSFVHEPGPGKCPICGMSLIPVPENAVTPRGTASERSGATGGAESAPATTPPTDAPPQPGENP